MLIRCQIVWPYFTNLPKDVWTNTLYYWNADGLRTMEQTADLLNPFFDTFYTTIYGGSRAANYVTWNAGIVNYYNMLDPEPRQPYTLPLSLAGITTAAAELPTEVSAVLSFQGDPLSGTPQSRRRGRIYLGGLASNWVQTSSTTAFPQFTSAQRQLVVDAAEANLMNHGISLLTWRVYSPTTGTSAVVTNGWMDNTPDTQRRRGIDATARTLFP